MEKELKNISLSKLKPYKNNPRLNDGAVECVTESIKQCGYISPIIIDENNEVLAGHTRLKALINSGIQEADVVIVRGLSAKQKRKYRVLDNKTNEFAIWDFEKLEGEIEGLDFEGFDFGFDEDNVIGDLLGDAFSDVGTKEAVVFTIAFEFPAADEETIKDYVKKIGKDTISNNILRAAKKEAQNA